MKNFKTLALVVLIVMCVGFYTANAYAFHGENLVCSSCHTMHDSQDGQDVGVPGTNNFLLKETGTELCLSCHASGTGGAPIVKGAAQDLAAGDFDNVDSNDGYGHNVDPSNPDGILGNTPPGGTTMGYQMSCGTCHDPHGNDNYRILRKDPAWDGGSITVTAIGDDDYEKTVSASKHNIYQSGMQEFCADCHGGFHGTANTNGSSPFIRHPGDYVISGTEKTNYGTTYRPLIPFEDATDNAGSMSDGPDGVDSKVFCLSCHRAHASEYSDATRWNTSEAQTRGQDNCNACHNK